MNIILQVWGGSFYLLNKVLFAIAEGREARVGKTLKIVGWIVYILGVPAWVIILGGHNDWIAASIEAGGLPAMFFGLYNTFYENKRQNKLLSKIVSLCTYSALVFGLYYSLNIYGGITSITQILEMGVMLGFLLGSYLLAQNNPKGWVLFMLMNISMAVLMLIQGKHILMMQQIISLGFVIYGFSKTRQNSLKLSV